MNRSRRRAESPSSERQLDEDDEERAVLNDFAERSLRDAADQDYLASRLSYRACADTPFLWQAHQAVEKYLKGILLFNRRPCTEATHDIERSLDDVQRIEEIRFALPETCRKLVRHLNDNGQDRYHLGATYFQFEALMRFDRTIWHLRRYCQVFHIRAEMADGGSKDLFDAVLRTALSDAYLKAPQKFRILGGWIERIVSIQKPVFAYRGLTWHNLYFGSRVRTRLHRVPMRSSGRNSTLVLHPNHLKALARYVYIPKEFAREVQRVAEAAQKGLSPI